MADLVTRSDCPMNIAQSTSSKPRLGIISALAEEQAGVVAQMQNKRIVTHGMRDYVCGSLWGVDCVCVLARIGKVGAATTTTMLIAQFGVTDVLFTGVAGGANAEVKVGDIVIADQLVQHDMDCRPLFPRYEIPLTGKTCFHADEHLSRLLRIACQDFLSDDFAREIAPDEQTAFALHAPQVHLGLIASADEFVAQRSRTQQICQDWPQLLALEMEGAALAQVCYEFGLPFAVMRTISDGANEDSAIDFTRFIEKVAARYAYAILHRFCALYRQ
jgi:adenosylhomocysteine nucleosidase